MAKAVRVARVHCVVSPNLVGTKCEDGSVPSTEVSTL